MQLDLEMFGDFLTFAIGGCTELLEWDVKYLNYVFDMGEKCTLMDNLRTEHGS